MDVEGRWIAWHRQNRIAWHRRIRIAWHRPVCLAMSLTSVGASWGMSRRASDMCKSKVRHHPTPPTPANPSASMCASPRYAIIPHHLPQQTRRLVCVQVQVRYHPTHPTHPTTMCMGTSDPVAMVLSDPNGAK